MCCLITEVIAEVNLAVTLDSKVFFLALTNGEHIHTLHKLQTIKEIM